MMKRFCRGAFATGLIVGWMWVGTLASAQDQSLRPGINQPFDKPAVGEWLERFEKEGREVYDKRQALVATCQISPGMSVADVGAGTGLFTLLFAQQVGPAGHVYAVDISDEFIESIQERAAQAELNNIQGVICAVDDAKLAPASVDVVYICDTYHHFEFPYKTMASIFKALKPGGRVVVVDFQRIPGTSSDWVMGHVRAGREEVRQEIESVGFKLQEEKQDLLKENYVLVFGKAQ
jgi:ubiquinone/menaquinone biosynthesis C-methylase UbiE